MSLYKGLFSAGKFEHISLNSQFQNYSRVIFFIFFKYQSIYSAEKLDKNKGRFTFHKVTSWYLVYSPWGFLFHPNNT